MTNMAQRRKGGQAVFEQQAGDVTVLKIAIPKLLCGYFLRDMKSLRSERFFDTCLN